MCVCVCVFVISFHWFQSRVVRDIPASSCAAAPLADSFPPTPASSSAALRRLAAISHILAWIYSAAIHLSVSPRLASSCSNLEHLSCLSLIRSAHRHQDEKQTVHALTSCPHIELVNITKETLFCDCRRSLKYRLSSLSTTARTRALAPGLPCFQTFAPTKQCTKNTDAVRTQTKNLRFARYARERLSLSLSLSLLRVSLIQTKW